MLGYKICHKDLIKVLPTNILFILYQNLANYALNPSVPKAVNPYKWKLSLFNKSHYFNYCCEVCNELNNRNLDKETKFAIDEFSDDIMNFVSDEEKQIGSSISYEELFDNWHTDRYYDQCYYALQEMYDYDLLTYDEWKLINENYK